MKWIATKNRLPETSCQVIVVCVNENGIIYNITNINYSSKYKMFNACDRYTLEEADKFKFCNVIAWAPFEELETEIQNMMEVE